MGLRGKIPKHLARIDACFAIDEASDEPFPAGDPASWTPVMGVAQPAPIPAPSERSEKDTPAEPPHMPMEDIDGPSALAGILVLVVTLGVVLYALVWLIVALS
jgi:hypothetical protein